MLKYFNFDIVFSEIPDETTLAINLTNCPFRCPGCHSPHLREDIGRVLDREELQHILGRYGDAVTCVCFMGGNVCPAEVAEAASEVRDICPDLKTAWYSGDSTLPEDSILSSFDYIKVGPYIEDLGPLTSPTTNQRLYRISKADGALMMDDITYRFR